MGNIYDSSTFKDIANVLGLSDKQFQDQLIVTAGTAASYLQLGRQFVYDTFPDSASNSVLDAATLLGQLFKAQIVSAFTIIFGLSSAPSSTQRQATGSIPKNLLRGRMGRNKR